jgi:hypothetical protein
MRLCYYLHWFYWSGITNAALDEEQPRTGRRVAGVPLYLVKRAAIAACRATASAIACRPRAAIDQAIDLAYAAGYAVRCRRPFPRVTAAPSRVRA